MIVEVPNLSGSPAPIQIDGAGDNRVAERRREAYRDHVGGDELTQSDPSFAAYGDLATGLLALLALLAFRVRSLFWLFVAAFNVVGFVDHIGDYVHAVQLGLPEMAGKLGALYAVPVIYVPLLMITHVAAMVLVLLHRSYRTNGVALHAPRGGEA